MLIGYHGTTTPKAKNILESGRFLDSKGDRHWLGNGVYFFAEELHAYLWNRNQFKNKTKCFDTKELLDQYEILCAEIQNERNFDLDIAEYKLIFEEAYRKAVVMLAGASSPNRNICAEGVILNLMFTRMGFDNDFDLVTATFQVKIKRYDSMPLSSRLRGIPQRQICVKNCSIISKVTPDDISLRITDLEKKASIIDSPISWNYDSGHRTHYNT